MACNPTDILARSSFNGLGPDVRQRIKLGILSQFLNPSPTVDQLIADAGVIHGLSKETKKTLQLQLLCEIKRAVL